MKRSFLLGLISIGAAVLTLLAVFFGVKQYRSQNETVFRDVTVELGIQTLSIDSFLIDPAKKSGASFVSDVSAVDLGTAGTTQVTLQRNGRMQTVALTVRDTVAPAVEFKTELSVTPDIALTPEDFIVSISDLSSTTAAFVNPPADNGDHADQQVQITVTDRSGNATTGTSTLRYELIRTNVMLELGQELTLEHIFVFPQEDGHRISQQMLDQINQGGIGEYTLSIPFGSTTRTCTVKVQDTLPPELELQLVAIYPHRKCDMEDFIVSCTDISGVENIELLTELPFGKEGDHTVQIRATDKNGISVTKETILRINNDITPPQIFDVYNMSFTANSGTPDLMRSVSAFDSVEGRVEVRYDDSQVDLTRAGIYYLTYIASDSVGNTATRQCKIVVKPDYQNSEQLVLDIADSLTETDPESLRDFVRENISYNSNWGGSDPISVGFTNWSGNCYVHALCLQALLDHFGYENELIWVYGKTHYWNLVKIDGTWYHIDSTPGRLHSRYSLMNNQQRLQQLSGRSWDTSLWPQLNEE